MYNYNPSLSVDDIQQIDGALADADRYSGQPPNI
jgi:hypothetical protein